MQDGTTADMIWGVAELIEYISALDHARAGRHHRDRHAVRASGVFRDPPVFLEPGDRVRCEIDGIGSVENPIIDWSDVDDDDDDLGLDQDELDELIGGH